MSEDNSTNNKGEQTSDQNEMNMDDQSHESEQSELVKEGIIDLEVIDENNDGKVYQDMMDWNVISDQPGECPLCGMTLQEVTLKEAKNNLEEHGYEAKELSNQTHAGNENEYGVDSPLIRTGGIDLETIDENNDGKVYQDFMDWNVIFDEPGRCPVCNMVLQEVTLEKAKSNLIEHGYQVK